MTWWHSSYSEPSLCRSEEHIGLLRKDCDECDWDLSDSPDEVVSYDDSNGPPPTLPVYQV